MNSQDHSLSLYVHFPWCIKKCPYCDFNSHQIKSDLPEVKYIDALLHDLKLDLQRFNLCRPISSIFFGGGTPSLFSADSFQRLLAGIEASTSLHKDLEITLEANPGTFDRGKFAEFRAVGINRLSIGVQSFNDLYLTRLGRVHTAREAVRATEIAHRAGFDNLNLDLMFGLPGSSVESTLNDVNRAIELQPTHISFYQLTLEPNTYFHKFPPVLPKHDEIYRAQQLSVQKLYESGFQQYEISAYAKEGFNCRHNLNYWRFGDYLGIGAGAHGKISLKLPRQICRSWKTKHPDSYLNTATVNESATNIALHELPVEFVMNNLRLKKGFSREHYAAVTGLATDTLEPALSECIEQGLIVFDDNHYRCSTKGWDFLDAILEKFMPDVAD